MSPEDPSWEVGLPSAGGYGIRTRNSDFHHSSWQLEPDLQPTLVCVGGWGDSLEHPALWETGGTPCVKPCLWEGQVPPNAGCVLLGPCAHHTAGTLTLRLLLHLLQATRPPQGSETARLFICLYPASSPKESEIGRRCPPPPRRCLAGEGLFALPVAMWEMRGLYLANICVS